MVLWYCMVMSCIDTAEVILSDWRDTGTGMSKHLKKQEGLSWTAEDTRASDEARNENILY